MAMTEHDPTRDERFQVAALGVPGAMPIGDQEPDAGDVISSGGLTPDGRKAEGGISGSSVRIGDRVFKALAAGSGGLLLVIMAAIAIFLVWKAIPAFTQDTGNIFTTQTWNPQGTPPLFGMAAVFFGTIISSVIAMAIGVPIAVGVAMYISHYATRRASTVLGGLIDLLAAVPSLVFGMWGLYFLIPNTQGFQMWLSTYLGWIPLFKNQTATTAGQYGKDLLIAGIILAIMIIPIVSAVTREVFLQVPRDTIDAAWALGATKWEMIRTAVLPFGRAGIISASMLGLGRALGETIAVALVLNSGYTINWHLTEPGGDTFASTIALKFGEAGGSPVAIAALIAAGLFLFVITLVVNTAARIVIARKKEFTA
jgi:phosphate transport system permease protein